MSKKNIKEILCENCKMNCKNLANNSLVFNCFFNHNDADALLIAWNFCASQHESEVKELATACHSLAEENEELKKKLEEAVAHLRKILDSDVVNSEIIFKAVEFLKGVKGE